MQGLSGAEEQVQGGLLDKIVKSLKIPFNETGFHSDTSGTLYLRSL